MFESPRTHVWQRRFGVFSVAAVLTMAATTATDARSSTAANGSKTAYGDRITGWLHTVGTRIVDSSGKTVVFHGIDSSGMEWNNAQGTEIKGSSGGWATFPASEYTNLQAWGFNMVRIPISWANIEPTPGHYNTAYLQALDSEIAQFRVHHIAVVIDMHQVAWSSYFTFPRSSDGKIIHGNGMPAWLYQAGTDRHTAINDLYSNVNGQADEFVAVWKLVMERYANNPTVIGADVLNEPAYVNTQNLPLLEQLYTKAGSAIRSVDPHVLLMFEGLAQMPKRATMPPFANTVYSWHFYAASWTVGQSRLAVESSWAAQHNVPFWVGEFAILGINTEPAGTSTGWMAQTRQFFSYAKAKGISWTFWAYQRTRWPLMGPGGGGPLNTSQLATLQAGMK